MDIKTIAENAKIFERTDTSLQAIANKTDFPQPKTFDVIHAHNYSGGKISQWLISIYH